MDTRESFLSRLKANHFTRVVGFGSSNTERRIAGMHWLDCFELACRSAYGPITSFVNSGRGGDSTIDLLGRMERDCLAHQPHLVFITVGGNDSNPEKAISVDAYRMNLRRIITELQSQDAIPVLQTYYAVDLPKLEPGRGEVFHEMMEVVRELGRQPGCMLIDHLARWEPLRTLHYERFQRLMLDPFHVNAVGNLVLGLDIVRAFGLSLPDDPYFQEARVIQTLLDELSATDAGPCR